MSFEWLVAKRYLWSKRRHPFVGVVSMISMIGIAVGVAALIVVLAVMNGYGIVRLAPKTTLYAADIIGGLLLGAGIALAGACPGTVAAQVGVGYKDAWFTLAGGLVGAVAFTYLEPWLKTWLLTGGPGKITLATVTGAPFWTLALGFAAILIACLWALETWRPWRSELGANADGLLPLADHAMTAGNAPAHRPQAAA